MEQIKACPGYQEVCPIVPCHDSQFTTSTVEISITLVGPITVSDDSLSEIIDTKFDRENRSVS
jgi:hypothetical protein